MKTPLPIAERQLARNWVRSLGAGVLMLLAGCASFDTSYTDPKEAELSLWGGVTKHEYYANPFLGLDPRLDPRPSRRELERQMDKWLQRKVDALPKSATGFGARPH